jgi:hypothetical protein
VLKQKNLAARRIDLKLFVSTMPLRKRAADGWDNPRRTLPRR